MPTKATYYLGRVRKLNITQEQFVEALCNSGTIMGREYFWTFIDTKIQKEGKAIKYVYAKMAKYLPTGSVPQVDEKEHESKSIPVDKLLNGASSFVYIPEYSGIAFQHVWNKIEYKAFMKRFADIVNKKFESFFAQCEIENVSEYKVFIEKIRSLSRVINLKAKVYPPNPLYGRLWISLRDYLCRRALVQLKIEENAAESSAIKTNINNFLQNIENSKNTPDICDAAILMAADGYGVAKIEGYEGKKHIVIKTSDIAKSFKYFADPVPDELYELAKEAFEEISKERYMKHD